MVFLWPHALHDPLFAALERSLIDGAQQSATCRDGGSRAHFTHNPKWSGGCQSVGAAAAGPRWPVFAAGRFDILEREDAFELLTDAPGFDPADIAVEVEEGMLTISAKHEERKEQQPQQAKEQHKLQEQQEQKQAEQEAQKQQEERPEQWSFVEAPKEVEVEAQPDKQQTELDSQQEHSDTHKVAGQQPSGSRGAQQAETRSKPDGDSQFWRRERHVQQFVRRFKLPDEAKADGIVARLDKGLLTVTVPKLPPAPKPQVRRIQVQG